MNAWLKSSGRRLQNSRNSRNSSGSLEIIAQSRRRQEDGYSEISEDSLFEQGLDIKEENINPPQKKDEQKKKVSPLSSDNKNSSSIQRQDLSKKLMRGSSGSNPIRDLTDSSSSWSYFSEKQINIGVDQNSFFSIKSNSRVLQRESFSRGEKIMQRKKQKNSSSLATYINSKRQEEQKYFNLQIQRKSSRLQISRGNFEEPLELYQDSSTTKTGSRMNRNQIKSSSRDRMHSSSKDRDRLYSNSLRTSQVKTTGRKNYRQNIVSLIEYCSNEVGLAIFNVSNGEIFLCQLIERLTYFQTISTLERFYPLQIIFSLSLQHTQLIKKLKHCFRSTNFKGLKRSFFDETRGYELYQKRGNKQQYNPDNKFIAYSALNALVYYIENEFYSTHLAYSSLRMRWHTLEDVLIIESQSIRDLEIFFNQVTLKSKNCFIDNFQCLTEGGNRMLRANILQPLSNKKLINERHQLVETLLRDKFLFEVLCKEIAKFKNFELITAKFIHFPIENNIRSLRSYLSAIYHLSHLCRLLSKIKTSLGNFQCKQIPLLSKLAHCIENPNIQMLSLDIQENFEEQMLNNYEQNKNRKDSFNFLFKVDKIEDVFAELTRVTYSHTLEELLQEFRVIKQKSKVDLKLGHNIHRGYFIKIKKDVDLNTISLAIQTDVIQVSQMGQFYLFSTPIISSLNNRLMEGEKKMTLQAQSALMKVIQSIQLKLDVLFDLNYEMSTIDMIISFAKFIKKYNGVNFSRPIFSQGGNKIELSAFRSIWAYEKNYSISEQISFCIDSKTSIMIHQKNTNSYDQKNILFSIGYLTILSQIGCFVPAKVFITDIYDTLMSKVSVHDNIETNLSHFQLQIHSFKNILDNSTLLHRTNKNLVLIDELVKGTQYQEEICLSIAVIKQLAQMRGITVALVSDQYELTIINQIAKEGIRKNQEEKNFKSNNIQIQKLEKKDPQSSLQQELNNIYALDPEFIQNWKNLQEKCSKKI